MEIIWGRFVEKTRGQKSRATVPLTKSCRVSDPTEQSPAGYQTPRNNIPKRIFLRIRKRIQKCFRV
jgi:hypothetical protein